MTSLSAAEAVSPGWLPDSDPEASWTAMLPGAIAVRLPYTPPLPLADLLAFLGTRAVPGVETLHDGVYLRTLHLAHGSGVVALSAAEDDLPAVRCLLRLDDPRDHAEAVRLCRRLLDLNAEPRRIDAHLGRDPLLAPLVQRTPGLRVPGAVDGAELAVRAILGQQVSVAGARTLAGRLVARYGEPLSQPHEALTHHFPTPASLLSADPGGFSMPRARVETLFRVCEALDSGDIVLDPEGDLPAIERALLALRGIGPWTASYIAIRALGDPDAFLPADLGVKHAFRALGLPHDPKQIAARAESWRPWRAYANFHLWATLGGEGERGKGGE